MAELVTGAVLKRTPLYDLHVRLGARMVPFAGYEMPVQYPTGIIKEHLQTRAAAGLFDVSHMGQIALRPRSGRLDEAARALETLVPVDVLGLPPGRQRYAFFTNAAGGVLDDLMVSNQGDRFMLVVNAARKGEDQAYLLEHLSPACFVEAMADRALVALQGPRAEAALASFTAEVRSMRFMDVRTVSLLGEACVISRSGYTGEDGFEISIRADKAEALCMALLADATVAPAGLGARDSLRLEAGLCLYGHDIDVTTSPVEAALVWSMAKRRREQGGFPGAARVQRELQKGPVRVRVGILPEGRAPAREGTRSAPVEYASGP